MYELIKWTFAITEYDCILTLICACLIPSGIQSVFYPLNILFYFSIGIFKFLKEKIIKVF